MIGRLLPARLGLDITLILCAVAIGLSISDLFLRREEIHRNCIAIEHLKSYAYRSAISSLRTLPTLSYYRQHPRELRQALTQLHEQRDFFAPQPCP